MRMKMAAVLGCVALAGCQAGLGGGTASGVDVTRFHLGQAVAQGEIAVEPSDRTQAGTLAFSQISAPVARELARLGWRLNPGNARSEQVAVVSFRQGSRADLANRPSVSFGVGAGAGSYGSGGGVGIGASVPIGGNREVVASELAVRIQRRSDSTVIWEGRAQSEARAGADTAMPAAAADRLASALFAGFPGESGRTIRVR